MKSEAGLSLIEVVWTIVIIASFGICIFSYRFKHSKILINNITEKSLLINYIELSETFRCEYENFDIYLANKLNEKGLYEVTIPVINKVYEFELIYNKEQINNNMVYTLMINYPDSIKELNYNMFNDKTVKVVV